MLTPAPLPRPAPSPIPLSAAAGDRLVGYARAVVSRRRIGLVGALALAAIVLAALVAAVMLLVDVHGSEPPRVSVRAAVTAPGLDVASIDEAIAEPLARALAGTDPTVEVRVVSREGSVSVRATAPGGVALAARARDALDALELPEGAAATVLAGDGAPALRWVVRGPDAVERQRALALSLERLPGVRAVESCGGEEEITVTIDRGRAEMHGVGASEIVDVIAASSSRRAGGLLDVERARGLRALGASPAGEDIGALAVRAAPEPLFVRDVASIATVRAPHGCECVDASGACATGSVVLEPSAAADPVRALVREHGGALLTARVTLATPAGTPRDDLLRLAAELARRAAPAPAVVEVQPIVDGLEPRADLALMAAATDPPATEEALRDAAREVPGLAVQRGSGPCAEVEVAGADPEALERAARAIADAMRGVPGLRSVAVAGLERTPELTVELRPESGAALGVDARALARALELATRGAVISQYRSGSASYDVRVRAPVPDDELGSVLVPASGGAARLDRVATLRHAARALELRRCGVERCATIRVEASAAPIDAARELALAAEPPPGVSVRWIDPRASGR